MRELLSRQAGLRAIGLKSKADARPTLAEDRIGHPEPITTGGVSRKALRHAVRDPQERARGKPSSPGPTG